MIELIITIMILIAFGMLALLLILGVVWYIRPFKALTWLYHDILGWHKPNGIYTYDGVSDKSHCKICGKEVLRDSQGNWFAMDE